MSGFGKNRKKKIDRQNYALQISEKSGKIKREKIIRKIKE